MLFITAATLVWLVFFQAVGNSLLLILNIKQENPFLAIWIGFFTSAVLSLLISFFSPLDANIARILIYMSALPGILPTFHDWHALVSGLRRNTLLFCACCFCLILLAQNFATCFATMGYDTDLYHQQTVRWLKEYGLVPGLGNLHGRLGHVSGWLALAAIVDWGPFQALAAYIMPALLLLSAALYMFYGACSSRCLTQRLYLLIMLLICCIYVYISFYPNLYYDRSSLLLYCIFISELLPVFYDIKKQNSCVKQLVIASFLISAAILFKPIPIPGAIFFIILLCIIFFSNKLKFHNILLVMVAPLATATIWCAGNSILTGYPLFPLTLFPLPFEWTMDRVHVDGVRHGVQGFARWPGHAQKSLSLGLAYWFLPWLARNLANKVFLVGVALPLITGCVLWGVAFCRRGRHGQKYFFFSLSFATLVYWFFQHPDYRFGLEFFWSWMSLAVVYALTCKQITGIPWTKLARCFLAVVVCLAVALIVPALSSEKVWSSLHKLQIPTRHGIFPGVQPRTLHAGTAEEYILFTSEPKKDRCGNSPLPCRPGYFAASHDKLFLREPGNLGAGFIFKKVKP